MNPLNLKRSALRATLQISALVILATSSLSLAHFNRELCHGFLPENDMKIPVGFNSLGLGGGGLDESQFNAILDRAERLYAPVVAQAGGRLKVNRKWTDATVNASADQQGRTWNLNMYGGMARHPNITQEGFALVVCHELGHHLGGAPKIQEEESPFPFPFPFPGGGGGGMSWATNEGGADYFANLKCMRNFFAEDDNQTVIDTAALDGRLSPFAAKLCEQEFTAVADQLLCKRGTLGGTSVALVFQNLKKETTVPSFETPDLSVTKKMDDNHPKTQCRIDTYLAGAICNVDKTVALSDSDYRQGSCVENVAKVGFRPRCWFAP